jgi:hypothetical protein
MYASVTVANHWPRSQSAPSISCPHSLHLYNRLSQMFTCALNYGRLAYWHVRGEEAGSRIHPCLANLKIEDPNSRHFQQSTSWNSLANCQWCNSVNSSRERVNHFLLPKSQCHMSPKRWLTLTFTWKTRNNINFSCQIWREETTR